MTTAASRWRRLSIRTKVVVLITSVTAAALLVATAALVFNDVRRFRAETQRELSALAQVLAGNTTAPLLFDDPAAATETLGAVRVRQTVRLACLYTEEGRLFASYRRPNDPEICPLDPPREEQTGFADGDFSVVSPVAIGGRRIGSLYLGSSLSGLQARLRAHLTTLAVILLLAGAFALALSTQVQKAISGPIQGLAATAAEVARGNYAVRATAQSEDEIGGLVGTLNGMLEHIQERDAQLQNANRDLLAVGEERAALLDREREARQDAEEANRLKDEFLATLSHELRTPLNAILGWATVLRADDINAATAARGLEAIDRNARAQAQLVSDILDVSRIITGKLRLERRHSDVAAIAREVHETLRPGADSKNLQVVLDLPADLPPVLLDPERFRQILWNLLSNAIKFAAPGGHVRVGIAARPGTLQLEVADDGIGIAPEFLPHVFERFRQADSSTTRRYGGLGLGLAIVRHLVELHGGTVEARSAGAGKGATFLVSLPQPEVVDLDPRLAQRTVAAAPSLHGLRVLVVEDNPDTVDLVRTALERAGASVDSVDNVAAAVAVLNEGATDLLVADIGLPGEDGYSLIRQLRQLEAGGTEAGDTATPPLPAIALTAYAAPRDRERALREGFQLHLAKPFDPSDLVSAVARLARSSLQPAGRVPPTAAE